MAFQDGVCTNAEYTDYMAASKACADEFGVEYGNNVRPLSEIYPINFPKRHTDPQEKIGDG